jgi:general stress protein YciG
MSMGLAVSRTLIRLKACTGEIIMRDQDQVLQSNTSSTPETPGKRKRGFAAMDPAQVRELARRGGTAAHQAGTAHEFSSDEARAAGRKGGMAARAGRTEGGVEGIAVDEPALPELPT